VFSVLPAAIVIANSTSCSHSRRVERRATWQIDLHIRELRKAALVVLKDGAALEADQ